MWEADPRTHAWMHLPPPHRENVPWLPCTARQIDLFVAMHSQQAIAASALHNHTLCAFAANNLPATASRVMGRPRSVRPFANFTRKNSAVHPPRHVRSVHSALEWICALFRPSHRPGSVRTQRATPFQAKRSEPVEARMGSPLQSISGLT